MATTEIEKLERRYAENPQGLTFAPLAEVHRKNGDIPRALELLKSGLELHPNYIPASIVLGRCHWDQGDLAAAESAFSHVLRLDDENVIALKSLADISERLGRASEARRWLKRLISIDRSNEEARQHLTRLEGAKAEPPPPSEAPAETPVPIVPRAIESRPPPAEIPKTEEPAPLDLTAAIAEPATPKSEAPSPAPSPSPALELLDTSEAARRAEPVSQAAEPSPVQEEVPAAGQSMQVDGLISQEFIPPKEGGYRLHPELTQQFEAAADAAEQLEVETAAEVELQSSGASEFRVPNAAEDFMEAARRPELPELTIELPREPPAAAPPPAPPATATPPPAPPPPAPTPAARPSYSVRETRGQSVAAFFQAMLTARPPGGLTAEADRIQQDGRAPAMPAREAAQPAEKSVNQTASLTPGIPAAAPSQDTDVSFDDFFGAAAGGSGAPKSTDTGKDDLDQFQSWLQNLKR
jgi:tetratricopeptide (TPR) repeat protein